MATRNPKNLDEALDEIQKGAEEMCRARDRYRKATNFLLHYGNTPGASSKEYHYSSALSHAIRHHFVAFMMDTAAAAVQYNNATAEDKS